MRGAPASGREGYEQLFCLSWSCGRGLPEVPRHHALSLDGSATIVLERKAAFPQVQRMVGMCLPAGL